MKRPLIPVIGALVCGILCGFYFQWSTLPLLVSCGLVTLGMLVGPQKRVYHFLILLVFLLGVVRMDHRMEYDPFNDRLGLKTGYSGEIIDVTRTSSGALRYTVRKLPETILMAVTTSEESVFDIGEVVAFRGVLNRPKGNGNPGLFQYDRYLKARGIHYTLFAQPWDIEKLPVQGSAFLQLKSLFHHKVTDYFDSVLAEHPSRLMKSVVLGKNLLDETHSEAFRMMGLTHLLAASGLHIQIILAIVVGLFLALGFHRTTAEVLGLAISLLYSSLIGFPPSILRSLVMVAVVLGARVLKKPYDGLTALGVSMGLLLVVNPFILYDTGFQLSFVATFAMVVISPGVLAYIGEDVPLRGDVALLIAIQLGLLPLQLYYFNAFHPITFLANLVMVPIFTIAMGFGIVGLIGSMVLSLFGEIVGVVLQPVLGVGLRLLSGLSSWDVGVINTGSPSLFEMGSYYGLLFGLLYLDRVLTLKEIHRRFLCYTAMCGLVGTMVWTWIYAPITINVIDIGQGDSILIRDGKRTFLIDTGGSYDGSTVSGEHILIPFLEKSGIRKLDGVFLTHPDGDHIGNYGLLRDAIAIDRTFISSAQGYPDDLIHAVVLKARDVDRRENLVIEIIHPAVGQNFGSNDGSLVLAITAHNTRLLMTGDLERAGENALLHVIPHFDILKVGHHGSKSSPSRAFIEKVAPRVGLISVGANNRYGHPDGEVLETLAQNGVSIYRTDTDGNVEVRVCRFGYEVMPALTERLTVTDWAAGLVMQRHTQWWILGYMICQWIILDGINRRGDRIEF